MSKIFNKVSNYIPYTTLRSINKDYNKMDTEYCKKAAFVYKDDMIMVNNKPGDKIIFYYNDNQDVEAILQNTNYIYKIQEKDDTVVLTVKPSKNKKEINPNDIIDIDIMSKYKILKQRGCEDSIAFYARDNTIQLLLNTFMNNLNPDNVYELMYLYMYLHANTTLMGYPHSMETKILKMDTVPPQAFMDEIYDMYNLIYVRLKLL